MKKLLFPLSALLVLLTACSDDNKVNVDPIDHALPITGSWTGQAWFDTTSTIPGQTGTSYGLDVVLDLRQTNTPNYGDFTGVIGSPGSTTRENVSGNVGAGTINATYSGKAINCKGNFDANHKHYEGTCTSDMGAAKLTLDKK